MLQVILHFVGRITGACICGLCAAVQNRHSFHCETTVAINARSPSVMGRLAAKKNLSELPNGKRCVEAVFQYACNTGEIFIQWNMWHCCEEFN
jgi:hypothetical protein